VARRVLNKAMRIAFLGERGQLRFAPVSSRDNGYASAESRCQMANVRIAVDVRRTQSAGAPAPPQWLLNARFLRPDVPAQLVY